MTPGYLIQRNGRRLALVDFECDALRIAELLASRERKPGTRFTVRKLVGAYWRTVKRIEAQGVGPRDNGEEGVVLKDGTVAVRRS